jgi:hypothetical protein
MIPRLTQHIKNKENKDKSQTNLESHKNNKENRLNWSLITEENMSHTWKENMHMLIHQSYHPTVAQKNI